MHKQMRIPVYRAHAKAVEQEKLTQVGQQHNLAGDCASQAIVE